MYIKTINRHSESAPEVDYPVTNMISKIHIPNKNVSNNSILNRPAISRVLFRGNRKNQYKNIAQLYQFHHQTKMERNNSNTRKKSPSNSPNKNILVQMEKFIDKHQGQNEHGGENNQKQNKNMKKPMKKQEQDGYKEEGAIVIGPQLYQPQNGQILNNNRIREIRNKNKIRENIKKKIKEQFVNTLERYEKIPKDNEKGNNVKKQQDMIQSQIRFFEAKLDGRAISHTQQDLLKTFHRKKALSAERLQKKSPRNSVLDLSAMKRQSNVGDESFKAINLNIHERRPVQKSAGNMEGQLLCVDEKQRCISSQRNRRFLRRNIWKNQEKEQIEKKKIKNNSFNVDKLQPWMVNSYHQDQQFILF